MSSLPLAHQLRNISYRSNFRVQLLYNDFSFFTPDRLARDLCRSCLSRSISSSRVRLTDDKGGKKASSEEASSDANAGTIIGSRSHLISDRPDITISTGTLGTLADGSKGFIEKTGPVAYQAGMETTIIGRHIAIPTPTSTTTTDTVGLIKDSTMTAKTTTTKVPTPTDSPAVSTTGENLVTTKKKRPIMVSKYRKDKNSSKVIKRAKKIGSTEGLLTAGSETGSGANTSMVTPHATKATKKATAAKATEKATTVKATGKADVTTVTTAAFLPKTRSASQRGNLSTISEVDQTPSTSRPVRPVAQIIHSVETQEFDQFQQRRPSQAPYTINHSVYKRILDWSVHPTVQSTDFSRPLTEYRKTPLSFATAASTSMGSSPSSTSRQATNTQDSVGSRAAAKSNSNSTDSDVGRDDFVAKRTRSRRMIGFDALEREMDSKSRTSNRSRSSRDSDYESRGSPTDGYRPNDQSRYGAAPATKSYPQTLRQSPSAWTGSSSSSSSSSSSPVKILSPSRSPTDYRKSAQSDVSLDYMDALIEQQPLRLQKTASESTTAASKAVPAPARIKKPLIACLGRVSESNKYELFFRNKFSPPQQCEGLVASTPPVWVVLSEALNPSTMESIIESASILGVEGIAIHGKSCAPLTSSEIQKMQLNSRVSKFSPLFGIMSAIQFIQASKSNGWHVVGVHQSYGSKRSLPYNVWPPTGVSRPTILVVGDTSLSINKIVARHCDMFVCLPTRQYLDAQFTLEGNVAAGIVLDRMLAGRYL